MITWTHLYHLDGRRIASTRFTNDYLHKWPWITATLMAEFDCDYDDIDMADDDCTITIRGVPMAYTGTEII
jgi:hypothetical protein